MASCGWVCSQQVTRLICSFISSLQLLFWTRRRAVISLSPFPPWMITQPPQSSLQEPRPPGKADAEERASGDRWGERGSLGRGGVQKSLSTDRRQSLSHSQKLHMDSLCGKKLLSYPNKIIADYNFFFSNWLLINPLKWRILIWPTKSPKIRNANAWCFWQPLPAHPELHRELQHWPRDRAGDSAGTAGHIWAPLPPQDIWRNTGLTEDM